MCSVIWPRFSVTHSFSVTSANIAINNISLKTTFFGLHFRCRKYLCIFNHFYVIRPESYRILWNYVLRPQPTTPIGGAHWDWPRERQHASHRYLSLTSRSSNPEVRRRHRIRPQHFDGAGFFESFWGGANFENCAIYIYDTGAQPHHPW